MNNLIQNSSFVTTVTLPTLKKLGPESADMEPYALRDAFEDVFDIQKMSQKTFDKLNCGYMLIFTDAFTSTIEGFLSATAIMNNLVFEEGTVPFCELEHCAWSIWEYMNLTGEMQNGTPIEEFCPDIHIYIKEAAKLNGIYHMPAWMQFAATDIQIPDLTGDVSVFEMFQNRQSNYIADLNGFVNNKQLQLAQELKDLQAAGLVG